MSRSFSVFLLYLFKIHYILINMLFWLMVSFLDAFNFEWILFFFCKLKLLSNHFRYQKWMKEASAIFFFFFEVYCDKSALVKMKENVWLETHRNRPEKRWWQTKQSSPLLSSKFPLTLNLLNILNLDLTFQNTRKNRNQLG